MLPIVDKLYTRVFYRDRWYFFGTLLSVVLNVGIWALIVWRFDILYQPGAQLALHYKVVYGIDFLGDWYYIFLIPLGGIGFMVLNYFFARMSYHYQRVVVYALMFVSSFCQAMLLLALYLIIQKNIF